MPDVDRVIRSRRVVLPDGMRPASIQIHDGIIAGVAPYDADAAGVTEDFGDLVIMPGLVDTHVHINEPGRTDWEGFRTATQAAAAGGVTTLIEMPLNSIPPTVSVEALETKVRAAEGKCWVDVGFWGGVIPGSTCQVRPLWEAGCFGFKCFLAPSGVDEFPTITEVNPPASHAGNRGLRRRPAGACGGSGVPVSRRGRSAQICELPVFPAAPSGRLCDRASDPAEP